MLNLVEHCALCCCDSSACSGSSAGVPTRLLYPLHRTPPFRGCHSIVPLCPWGLGRVALVQSTVGCLRVSHTHFGPQQVSADEWINYLSIKKKEKGKKKFGYFLNYLEQAFPPTFPAAQQPLRTEKKQLCD